MNEANMSQIELVDRLELEQARRQWTKVDRLFAGLMLLQWFVGITFALTISPYTWIGQMHQVHIHVWAAAIFGAIISSLPIFLALKYPGWLGTRLVIGVAQVLWSALLIHLSGGRVETHFHVFCSLAILAFYRDWRVLAAATIVVSLDHMLRGIWWPQSAFGVFSTSPWRWVEHAIWVVFEDIFLLLSCFQSNRESRQLCQSHVELAEEKRGVESKVIQRTAQLAEKTAEAEKLALVARSTDNAVIIMDPAGLVEWVNDSFTNMSGLAMEDVVGRFYGDVAEDLCKHSIQAEQLVEHLHAKAAFETNFKRSRPDGSTVWMSIEVYPIHDDADEIVKLVSIERDITAKIESGSEKECLQSQLLQSSRMAGMAETATSVLHNVGNVLNSVNVSVTLIREKLGKSSVDSLANANQLIQSNCGNFAEFIQVDRRGQMLPAFVNALTEKLQSEKQQLLAECECLIKNIEHIRSIVTVQQSVATVAGMFQETSLAETIEEALIACEGRLGRHGILVHRSFEDFTIVTDKHKVMQILINIVRNAKDSLIESGRKDSEITIELHQGKNDVTIEIRDNGVGISAERIASVFQFGNTTKKHGHGFGLHGSANQATELGGKLIARSPGEGFGASFYLTLPLVSPNTNKQSAEQAPEKTTSKGKSDATETHSVQPTTVRAMPLVCDTPATSCLTPISV